MYGIELQIIRFAHDLWFIIHNAQCTIFAINESNQACLDCRVEQKSQPKGVMHNAQSIINNFQFSTLNSQLSMFLNKTWSIIVIAAIARTTATARGATQTS